jgi:DNA-binding CsgD family transcriptional regulator
MDRSRLFMVQVCGSGGARHVVVGLDQGAPQRFDSVDALARWLFEHSAESDQADPSAAEPRPRLSSREFEVALMFAGGSNHKRVAGQLGLAPATVRNHLSACYRKLRVDNRAGLLQALATPHEHRPALMHLHHGAAAAGPAD